MSFVLPSIEEWPVFFDFIVHWTSVVCNNDRWLDYSAAVIWGRHAAS